MAIAYKPFKSMKMNTSKERSFYNQGQQFTARVLFTVWLLASVSPEGALAAPKHQMVPATTNSPGDPSLASAPPLPGGILQLPPDSPGSFWGDSAGSSPSIDAALQECMSQEALPFRGRDLLRTSPKASPVSEHFSFEAREGEKVRFVCQMGQWHAEVSSHIGVFSRRAVLPVVCSQGEDVASNLEVLSKYPSWQRQRQIHVLDRNVCPTLGEVVYVGELGLKGGGEGGEASGSGEGGNILQSTFDLVIDFNKASKEGQEERWPQIEAYFSCFSKKTPDQLLSQVAILEEYQLLAHLRPSDETKKTQLLREFFAPLNDKALAAKTHQEPPLMKALGYVLQHLSPESFGSDPEYLNQLARQVLEKLNASNTNFTPASYLTHGPRMDALYQVLILIQTIETSGWDSLQDGLYKQFKAKLEEIQKTADTYYPYYYHAQILLQALSLLERDPAKARNQDLDRKGKQVVESALHLAKGLKSIDVLSFQKGLDTLHKAFKSELLAKHLWYKQYQDLHCACILALNQPDQYKEFEQRLAAFQEEGTKTKRGKAGTAVGRKVVYYGIIQQLKALAINGSSASSEGSLSWLKHFAKLPFLSQDKDIMPALLESLVEICYKSAHDQIKEEARALLTELAPEDASQGEASDNPIIIKWLQAKSLSARLSTAAGLAFSKLAILFNEAKESLELPSADIASQLRTYYQTPTFACVPSLFEERRSRHVKDLECQLMLQEQKLAKQDKEEEVAGDQEDHVANHHERLEWIKTPIAPEDLFKKRSVRPGDPEKEIQRILLTGDPGTGKTTLSKQLAYQWSQGLWGQEFHTLYLLPVRNLQQDKYNDDNYRKINTLSTAIVNTCFSHDLPATEDEYNSLRNHIEQELQKSTTLVILDGLDERAGASEEILRQAQTGAHKLLILSRPYGMETERQAADIEVKHGGFNEDQLKSYVRSAVKDATLAESLLAYIADSEPIQKIVHIPVHLEIVCTLWEDDSTGVRKALEQGSLPSLYRKFAQWIWNRYTDKHKLQDATSDDLFNMLGQIALNAFKESQTQINQIFINEYAKTERAKSMLKDAGLLQYVAEQDVPSFYQFAHKTFQEYFAGRWLAVQFLGDEDAREQCKEFMRDHKYDASYGQTLPFFSGELQSQLSKKSGKYRCDQLSRLLELLDSEPKEIVRLQHALLQAGMLHEWLCVADPEEHEAFVSTGSQVVDKLQKWLSKGIKISYWSQGQRAVDQLMDEYWDSKDPELIRFILGKLHHTPLAIRPSQRRGYNEEAVLYLEGGGCKVWPGASEEIAQFRALLAGGLTKDQETFHTYSHGDARKAANYYQRALAIYEQVYKEDPNLPEIAKILNNLVNTWLALDDARQAVSFLERVLAVYEQVYKEDPNLPEIAETLMRLGVVYYSLGQYADAKARLEKALEIKEQHYGPAHPETTRALVNLGNVYWNLGQYADAKARLEEALGIKERLYGPAHPETAKTRVSLGNVYTSLGLYVEAQKRYRRGP